MHLSSTTGFVKWKTEDSTDLDYSALPLITRDNAEEDFQFTQEVRVASAAPRKLSDTAALKWQSGVFLFTQNYQQDAVNTLAPYVLSPFIRVPVNQYSPVSDLDDFGLGVFGQGTVTFKDKLDIVAGARVDYEDKNANLKTFFDPAIAPPSVVVAEDSFSHVSPQFAAAYRLKPEYSVYATVSNGFKAGGFNPASPAGSEAYGEETTWNVEGGLKTLFANGRVALNSAVFFIDWNDLQLNVPNLNVPGQIYIANVGGGLEQGRGVRSHRQARAWSRRLRHVRVHERNLQQRQHLGRPRRVGQRHPQHAGLHGQLRRPVRPLAQFGDERLRPRRRRAVRRVQVRRRELSGTGRVLARQLPGRRSREALLR